MTLYNLNQIEGTGEYGGLVKQAFVKNDKNEMNCGIFVLQPGESLKEFEKHESDEVFYIASGCLTVLLKQSDTLEAQAGQIVLIPKNEWHLSKNLGSTDTVVFWCNRD